MNFNKRKKSSRCASGLAAVYLLTNTVGAYATERTLWNDRREALVHRRTDDCVLAQASPLFNNGVQFPLVPTAHTLSQNPPLEAGGQALSSLSLDARKSLAWLPPLTAPFGEIRQIYLAHPGAPLVLHIQDAHDVEEAQRNMGGLVQALLKDGHVRLVGLEGATGAMPLDPFRQLPNKDITRGVLDLALRLGYIGGAELAAFDRPHSSLWGIESSDLYARNLGAFEKGERFKRQNQVWMDRVSSMAGLAIERWYGSSLKEFETHRLAYGNGKEGLAVWLPFLWGNRPRDGKYPQLSKLNGVLLNESALDFKAVERDRRSLADVLARALPPRELQTLVDQSLQQRSGRLSFAGYHRFLESLCARHSVKMGAYPHLKKYIEYVAGAEAVDRSQVIEELVQLEESVERRLAVKTEEKEVAAARRDLETIRKLVHHQLTPSEWNSYDRHRPDPAFVAKTLADLSGQEPPAESLQGLPFYEDYATLALKRNRALTDNLLTKMRQEKAKTAVLVAGGFHTEGLTQALKESGASFVVLGPRITKVPEHSQVLEAIVRDPLPLEKLLAGDVIHLATPRLTGSLDGIAGEAPGMYGWAEQGKQTLGSLQLAYQIVHAPGVDNSSFDALRRAGYLSTRITPEVLSLSSQRAVVVRGPRASGIALVESNPGVPMEKLGVMAEPITVEKMTVDGKPMEFRTYRPDDVRRPGVLVQWARRGVAFLVEAKRALSTVLAWGRARVLLRLQGFGRAWENFLNSRLGRMAVPVLGPLFAVPPSTGGGLESSFSGREGRPKKLADIFPYEPTRWSSVQKEALSFVLIPFGAGADSVRFLTEASTNEILVFALTTPSTPEAPAREITVRFSLSGEAFPSGELYSVDDARGPPAVDIAILSDVFRADNSSLKRGLSAVVQQALSTVPGAPFGRGNMGNYRAAQRAVRESQTRRPTWLEIHTPRLKNVSLFSRSMESIFNRTLAEQLQEKFGFDMLRFLSQTNFTGGLGHVTYDYHASLGLDGADIASIFPLWNWIKGVVKHAEGEQLLDGTPPLPARPDGTPYASLGDMLRDTLSKREDLPLSSFRLPESAAFWDWVVRGAAGSPSAFQWQCRKTLDLRGKDIQFDVYVVKDKYSGQPIFYLDAYAIDGGNKIRVFDDLYGDPPDAPWRAVQVLVYSHANQQLMGELIRQGYAQSTIVTLDHEVFAQFPDLYLHWQSVRGRIRHGIHAFNHTVFRPGLWNLPKPFAGLLGLDNRPDVDEAGSISIARAANERANSVTGVSRIHWRVLLKKLFAMEGHKVVDRFDPPRPDQGLSSTNGVLLEHWQGPHIRRLIDFTKEKLGFPSSVPDAEFFTALEQSDHTEELKKFQDRFATIKAFYVLNLLIFLNNTQTQPQGGGHWLAETLGDVQGRGGFTLANIRSFRDQWQFLISKSFADESVWEEIQSTFGDLKDALLKRPIVSNVRRQVSYKGPDMYRDILERDKETFQRSGIRLIFGGRTFDGGARGTFDYAKSLARDVGTIAFLENYNSEDAPVIYQGSMASPMMANEFVEAAATSNSKIVVNGGWLISVFDGASPERLAVLDKKTGEVKFAIAYTHDDLRAGLVNGDLEILNGSLIPFDDFSRSETDGKGAGRRPSRAGLLECFASLGTAYRSPVVRQEMLYRGIRWSYTADIHRQTRAFLDIENTIVLGQEKVDTVAERILSSPSAEGASLADQLKELLYRKGPDGFIWRHRHRVTEPAPLEGVGHDAGWVGFLSGFREVKRRYYDQGQGSSLGDEDGLGLWSLEHHVFDEQGKNELVDYVTWLLGDLPAFQPLRAQLEEIRSDREKGADAPSLAVRVPQTLAVLEFVQRTLDIVSQTVLRRDLEQGMALVGDRSESLAPDFRDHLFRQDYSFGWRIAVSPQSPHQDFDYLHSGPSMEDLRKSLRLLLTEGSQGSEAIKQASYGSERGGYFFSMMANRWGDVPALRHLVFSLQDEIEAIKTKGGIPGWSDPATQWEIRRVYAKFLGVLDELIEPTPSSDEQDHVVQEGGSVEKNSVPEAGRAVSSESLGGLDRHLLGGPAHPLTFGRLTADVAHIRSLVEESRAQAKSAQSTLSRSIEGWDLTLGDGRLSESAVERAGQTLSRKTRQQGDGAESASLVSTQVFLALASFGNYLEGASVEDWHRWVSVFVRGFNENIFEVQDRVLASIESGRRLEIEVSETMLKGTLTEEDKTRLEELTLFAAHAEKLKGGRLSWILPQGSSSLEALWNRYAALAPLRQIPSRPLTKADYRGEDGLHSVKKLLLDSQRRTDVDSLDPADLFLINRSEWVLESDLPKDVARLLISLAGGLIYDATEKIGDEIKSLFFLRTNA